MAADDACTTGDQVMKEIQLRNPRRMSLVTTVAGVLNVLACAPAAGAVVGVQVAYVVVVVAAAVLCPSPHTTPALQQVVTQTQTVMATSYPPGTACTVSPRFSLTPLPPQLAATERRPNTCAVTRRTCGAAADEAGRT